VTDFQPSELDPVYVVARSVLLDALSALAQHRGAVIVAGAQAVYLHAGAADLAIAPYTTDGDLALDPHELVDEPLLEDAMRAAGFHLAVYDGHVEPGIWLTGRTVQNRNIQVPVDLIVPEAAASGGGRRGARLGPHGRRAARRALGLEAALVDHHLMQIAALAPDDERVVTANVAGPAALLVAKAHKLNDRIQHARAERVNDKDAADVLRLMQTTSPTTVGSTLASLAANPLAGEVSTAAIDHLERLFGHRGAHGVAMAARALRMAIPQQRVEAICTAYTAGLIAAAR
jgi:hypothetical protein